MSIDLTTEITRIDEYENAHSETVTLDRPDRVESVMVDDEHQVESPTLSVTNPDPVEPVMFDEEDLVELPLSTIEAAPTQSIIPDRESATDPAAELWLSVQTNKTDFFENATSYITKFFKNNQQSLMTLGLIFLAIISIKLLFAGLNAIDDVPLVTPLLKLIGLVYVVRFAWSNLIRERNRQELLNAFNRTKAEVLGTQN
jgi:hypothetical protein